MQKIILVIMALPLVIHTSYARADQSVRADSHGPIGVMGEHIHHKGEWMLSYRFMAMNMQGNLRGSQDINADTIATTEPNRFAGMPNMPPTLRIVPRQMQMDMHMLGMMYAPSDRVTLMFMANFMEKSMRHTTYAGGAGTSVLADFSTASNGWGDLSVSGLIHLMRSDRNKLHAILGVSIPTGSRDETGEILAPSGMTPTLRYPYPMQLGSGTYDPIVGLSFAGNYKALGWGGQWRSFLRLEKNDDGYRLGNMHRVTAWLSYLFSAAVSGSTRIEYSDRGNIIGMDPSIMGPVQTADPDRQASQRVDAAIGLNFAARSGWRVGLEYIVPINQRLDGPQLKMDEQLVIGLQKAF